MLSELKRYYPTTKNAELADYFGVSQRTINRKAAELGLTKSKQFIADVSKENGYLALIKQR
jgi:Zn-dependent peptidase ImmA (M78 family)